MQEEEQLNLRGTVTSSSSFNINHKVLPRQFPTSPEHDVEAVDAMLEGAVHRGETVGSFNINFGLPQPASAPVFSWLLRDTMRTPTTTVLSSEERVTSSGSQLRSLAAADEAEAVSVSPLMMSLSDQVIRDEVTRPSPSRDVMVEQRRVLRAGDGAVASPRLAKHRGQGFPDHDTYD